MSIAAKLRTSFVLMALLLITIVATGCRYTAAPADLLQLPVITAENQALVAAIDKSLSEYSMLTLPLRDEHKEAIRLIDIDGDGIAEAVVSYFTEYSTPELMVMKQAGGIWRPWVFIEQPLARQMVWLKIEDLDLDGHQELLVGWAGAFDGPDMLEVYSFKSKAERNDKGRLMLKPIDSLPYTFAEAGDLNDDGRMELAVISPSGSNQAMEVGFFQLVAAEDTAYQLTVYEWKESGLKMLHNVKLAEGIHFYDRLLIGQVSPRHYGIVVEGPTGAHSWYTAMYAWEGRELRLVYPNEALRQDGVSGTTTKSGDVNGDGIIELHWTREAPVYSLPYSDSIWISERVQWDGKDEFNKIMEDYIDYRYGIQLQIPDEWIGRYTLRKPNEELHSIVSIDYWNELTDDVSELATLFAVPLKQWNDQEARWKEAGRSYRMLGASSGNMLAISFQTVPHQIEGAAKEAFEEMLRIEDKIASYVAIDVIY